MLYLRAWMQAILYPRICDVLCLEMLMRQNASPCGRCLTQQNNDLLHNSNDLFKDFWCRDFAVVIVRTLHQSNPTLCVASPFVQRTQSNTHTFVFTEPYCFTVSTHFMFCRFPVASLVARCGTPPSFVCEHRCFHMEITCFV